jgi:hypothetical protein
MTTSLQSAAAARWREERSVERNGTDEAFLCFSTPPPPLAFDSLIEPTTPLLSGFGHLNSSHLNVDPIHKHGAQALSRSAPSVT